MSTSIVLGRYSTDDENGYYVKFQGTTLANDMEELGVNLCSYIFNEHDNINTVKFDLTLSNDIFFKPKRLFRLCCYLNEKLEEVNRRIAIQLILTKQQRDAIIGVEENPCFSVEVCGAFPLCNSPVVLPSDQAEFNFFSKAQASKITIDNVVLDLLKTMHSNMAISIFMSLFALSFFILFFIYFSFTKIGQPVARNIISFMLLLLLYEVFVVFRIIYKKFK